MRTLLAACFVLLCAGALRADSFPAELQAKWHASGDQPMSWFLEYTFKADGTYTMTGYPPIEEHGQVEVVKHESRHYSLRLTHRIMMNDPSSDLEGEAVLSEDGTSLSFRDKRFRKI